MRRCLSALIVLAFAALPQLALGEDAASLTHWQAPLFWANGTATPPASRETLGRQSLALPSGPLPFIAIPPCRLLDTRGNGAPLTGGFLPPATVRSYTLTGVCGVPANAQAISLNATVVRPAGPGFLTLWPQGGTFPPVATLNYLGNDVIANAAVVALSVTGGISMALGVSGGDVILDTNGFYAPLSAVTSLNSLSGDLLLQAGANTSITPTGNTLTISSSGGLTGITAGTGIAVSGAAPSPTVSIPPAGIQADRIATAQVVKDVNGLKDSVTLAAGSNTILTPSGNTITIASVGTVTGVIAGTGLTGGGTGGSFSLGIASGGVNTLQLADNAVTAPKIASGQVVKSLNGLNDAVTLAGNGVTVSQEGQTITLGVSSGTLVYGNPGDVSLLAAGYTEARPAAVDFWTPTSAVNAPSPRYGHTAIWTGSRMIVWGGQDGSPTSGFTNTGAIYDPLTDTWTPMATAGAPAGRDGHSAIWTGSRMIVWGGNSSVSPTNFDDGGSYDPAGNVWYPISTTGAPQARRHHSAVWTGSRMIVWGGENTASGPQILFNTGAQYDPATDTWFATTTSPGVPTGRTKHSAVWTGNRMIVWGGAGTAGSLLNDGAQYFPGSIPGTDSWSGTSTVAAPMERSGHSAIWTGTTMVVWGGDGRNSGGRYDPLANTWSPTSVVGAPSPRATGFIAVWTGSRMMTWGNTDDSTQVNQYNPSSDSWAFSSTTGAPISRSVSAAVWTGTRLVVWGGLNASGYEGSGGVWRPLSLYIKN